MDTESATPAPFALHQDIAEFYDARYDEIDRLTGRAVGRLERERTQELLGRALPPAPAEVLDVGGGPGVYAAWLAALGHRVTLVDPVERHLAQAAAHGTFTVERGDARALAAADASYDAVLLLGPLYHLIEAADRERALREAARVVRPGGLIAAAFISRAAPLIDMSAKLGVLVDEVYEQLDGRRHDGVHEASAGFTDPPRGSPGLQAGEESGLGQERPGVAGTVRARSALANLTCFYTRSEPR